MQNFMKLQSKSYRTYYDLLAPFDLKMTDFCIASYLIPKVKSSAKFGEHGKDGKCFYRHDKRVKGLYYSTTLSKIIKNTPFHLTIGTLENSLNRLQNKYGIIYKHQTIRTKKKSGIQIFMPILDNDVRKYFNDKSYKTVINLNTIEGRKFKKRMSDLLKTKLSFCQNLVYRSYKNWKNNNDHIMNNHVNNNHVCNDGHGRHRKSSTKFRIKSMGLPTNVMNAIYQNTSTKHEAISCVTDITQAKEYINKKYNYKDIHKYGLDRNETNDYIQNGGLLKSLGEVFVFNSDLKATIKSEYKDYIKNHISINVKQSVNHQQHAGYQPDIIKIEDNLEYDYKHMKQCKANDDKQDYLKYKEAYNAENENAIDYCKNPSNKMTIEYVDYSKEAIHEQNSNKKPSKALTDKIKKQLRDMNKRDKMAE